MATAKANDMQLDHFRFEIDEHGVATVLMDLKDESMNVISPKLSGDLEKILDRVEGDATVRAVVLGSAKPTGFLAGADLDYISGIDTAPKARQGSRDLQRAFARLEALHQERSKPVVAAIHGPALGGGLEMALACSMRLASNDEAKTRLGLPETQVGLIPAAGGTQRLPRLIGVANALDLILTGKHLRPKKAKKLGLVDEIVPAPILLDVARERARQAAAGEIAPPKRGLARLRELAQEVTDPEFLQQLALEENPVGQRVLFKKARETLLKKTRGNYPAQEAALDVVRIGVQEGLEAGYAAEADRFGQLVVSPEARALMSIFFAQNALKKDNGTDNPDAEVRHPKMVGVLGGGLMGAGIALVTVTKAKTQARIKEVDDAGILRGLQYVNKAVRKDEKRRRISHNQAQRYMHMVNGTVDYSGFKNIDLVIEAVFEDLELKRKVLKDVEAASREDTIFASNTSSLPITEIAAASKHPETVIGMHYFSPVEKMPLLEVIVTEKTAEWVTATCVDFGKKQGKTVIVVNDGTGFYTSRILAPYMNEAAWLLAEGGDIKQIDDAMMDWGFPVGPIVLLDEVGIDVGGKVAKVLEKAFGDRLKAPGAMEVLAQDDRKGRKNGRGFYRYENGKKAGVDESVYAVLGQTADRKSLPKEEIQQRCGLTFVNEAALCLQEGILRSPRDGDVGAIFGLGFPPFTGGPFSYIDRVGAGEIVRRLERFAERYGKRFEPAQILRDYARDGKKFRG